MAKLQNKDALNALLIELNCSDLFSYERNPIIILAEQCNHVTVDFLKKEFDATLIPLFVVMP